MIGVCVSEAVKAHLIRGEDRPFLSSVLLEWLAVTQSSMSVRCGLVLNWFPNSGLAWDQILRHL